MDKIVKTSHLETTKYLDGRITKNVSANLEDNDYVTNHGLHRVDKLPDWYNDGALHLSLQDWIMTNILKDDETRWGVLYSLDGYTDYSPVENFKQMKL